MLNIDDIKQLWQRRTVPACVQQVREQIVEAYADLQFVADGHKYYRPDGNGGTVELKSVSEWTGRFSPSNDQDWGLIAERYGARRGMTREQVERMWWENSHAATNAGTGVHLYGENLFYWATDQIELLDPVIKPQYEGGYLFPHSPKETAALRFWEDVLGNDHYYPVLAETRIYTDVYAGTFDLLFYYHDPDDEERSGLVIFDYKTNRELVKQYAIDRHQMMKPPFDDLYDMDWSHYVLQLSAYQVGIENAGHKVSMRRIIWLKDDGTYELVKLPDVTQEIRRLIAAELMHTGGGK